MRCNSPANDSKAPCQRLECAASLLSPDWPLPTKQFFTFTRTLRVRVDFYVPVRPYVSLHCSCAAQRWIKDKDIGWVRAVRKIRHGKEGQKSCSSMCQAFVIAHKKTARDRRAAHVE